MMRRRNFLKLLATAAALPAVAPMVEALAPLVRVAPPIDATAYGVLTLELLEDAVRKFSARQVLADHYVTIGPTYLIEAYHDRLATDDRRFDLRSHSYRR